MKTHNNSNRHLEIAFPSTRPLCTMALLCGLFAMLPMSAFGQPTVQDGDRLKPSAHAVGFSLSDSAAKRADGIRSVGGAALAGNTGKYVPVRMRWHKVTSTCGWTFAPHKRHSWVMPPVRPIAPNVLVMPCGLVLSADIFQDVWSKPTPSTPPSSGTKVEEPEANELEPPPIPISNPESPTGEGIKAEYDGKGVHISKYFSSAMKIHYSGVIEFDSNIKIRAMLVTWTETYQNQSHNRLVAHHSNNHSAFGGNAMRSVEGNLHVNVAAGNNNAQANTTVIPAYDAAEFVFGSAAAKTFADQTAAGNVTANYETHNNAALGGNALRAADGNIDVNIVAGSNNGQQNSTALSVGAGQVAWATTSTAQNASGNIIFNEVGATKLKLSEAETGRATYRTAMLNRPTFNHTLIGRNALRSVTGNIGVNVAAGTGNLQSNSMAAVRVSPHWHHSLQPGIMATSRL